MKLRQLFAWNAIIWTVAAVYGLNSVASRLFTSRKDRAPASGTPR